MYLDAPIQCSFVWIDKTLIIVIELCQSLIRKTTSFLILSPLGYSFIHYSFQATPLGCIPFIPNSLHYYISLKFKRQPPLSSPSNQVSLKCTPSLLPTWELYINPFHFFLVPSVAFFGTFTKSILPPLSGVIPDAMHKHLTWKQWAYFKTMNEMVLLVGASLKPRFSKHSHITVNWFRRFLCICSAKKPSRQSLMSSLSHHKRKLTHTNWCLIFTEN